MDVLDTVGLTDVSLFTNNARIFVTGFSNSGKSFLVGQMIMKYIDCFEESVISGAEHFPVQKHRKIRYHTGDIAFNPLSRKSKTRLLVVYDDYMMDNISMKIIGNVFCRGRHSNISSIYINQSLYHNNPYHRTIALNSTHFLILRLRDINQLRYFGKTFMAKHQVDRFVEICNTNIPLHTYPHLLVDFSQTSNSKLMLRTIITGPGYEQVPII